MAYFKLFLFALKFACNRCVDYSFFLQDHVILTSYPPLPEWGPLDQEGLEASSDEGVEVSNSSPPGAASDEDEGVEASTVKPRSAGTSLKRPWTPEGYIESTDEEELIPRAAEAAKDDA